MRILIAGGGIGGLTTALCLQRAGFAVEVHERADAFSEVGAGIQLGPNAMHVLARLDLDEALAERAVVPERLEMRQGSSGRRIFSIAAGDAMLNRYGAPYLHIHRADLIEVLAKAAHERLGDSLKTGSEIVHARANGVGAVVELASGEAAGANAVIGADGVHSRVRESLFGPIDLRFTGYVAWRAVIPVDEEIEAKIPRNATVWTGQDRHAVTYRLRGGKALNFVGVVHRPDWMNENWSEVGRIEDLRVDFERFSPQIGAVIERIEAPLIWAIVDRPPVLTWGRGHVTLLGDAAHPMPPFMAQGAGMAIEDAWELAAALSELGRDVSAGLRLYESRRQARTAAVQRAAWRNLQVFHKTGGAGGGLMRLGMHAASVLAPEVLRRQAHWIYRWQPRELVAAS